MYNLAIHGGIESTSVYRGHDAVTFMRGFAMDVSVHDGKTPHEPVRRGHLNIDVSMMEGRIILM
jgi:hypothetical protein